MPTQTAPRSLNTARAEGGGWSARDLATQGPAGAPTETLVGAWIIQPASRLRCCSSGSGVRRAAGWDCSAGCRWWSRQRRDAGNAQPAGGVVRRPRQIAASGVPGRSPLRRRRPQRRTATPWRRSLAGCKPTVSSTHTSLDVRACLCAWACLWGGVSSGHRAWRCQAGAQGPLAGAQQPVYPLHTCRRARHQRRHQQGGPVRGRRRGQGPAGHGGHCAGRGAGAGAAGPGPHRSPGRRGQQRPVL
jgi:hypothetical protein